MSTPETSSSRRSAVTGFVAGVAFSIVVAGTLWIFARPGDSALVRAPAGAGAIENSNPMPQPVSSRSTAPGSPPSVIPQHSTGTLSAAAEAELAPLQAQLAANPDDPAIRKKLAVFLLRHDQLMAAFEHASVLLSTNPTDPDGLYVHGVVRLAMGQSRNALELLDQVLAQYPDHVLALIARGRAQRKIGDTDGAVRTWEQARQAAGGSHPEVEQLVAETTGVRQLDETNQSQLVDWLRSFETGS